MSSSILIVGAGPVGLTLGNFLTRSGVPCRLIDKAPHAAAESRALAVHARTLEMLDRIGLADRFVQQGVKIHSVNFRGVGRELMRLAFDGLPTPFPFILSIPQSRTEALLAETDRNASRSSRRSSAGPPGLRSWQPCTAPSQPTSAICWSRC